MDAARPSMLSRISDVSYCNLTAVNSSSSNDREMFSQCFFSIAEGAARQFFAIKNKKVLIRLRNSSVFKIIDRL